MKRVAWLPLLCLIISGCSSTGPTTSSGGGGRTLLDPSAVHAAGRTAAEQKLSALQQEREQLLATLGEFHDRIRELESMLADRDGRPVAKSYDELLASKEAELADLRKLIPEREKQATQLATVTASLENARQRVSSLEHQLGVRDQELASVRTHANAVTELEAARRRMAELEAQATKHDADLRALKSSGAERESLVAQLQTATSMLDKMKERVATLEHQISEREQEFGTLRTGLAERDKLSVQAKGLSSEVQQARIRITTLTGQLAEKTRELESLRGVITERDKLLSQLTARNAELSQAKQLMNELAKQGNGKPTYVAGTSTHSLQSPAATTPVAQSARASQTGLSQTKDELVKFLQSEGGSEGITVKERGPRLTVALPSHLLFSSGDATLKPEGVAMLKRIGSILGQRSDTSVQIAGHTDNQQLSKSLRKTFPNNKALSWARAENARRALINGGLPADLTKAVGYADSRPIATNGTEEGRQKNRRVELLIARSSGPAFAPQDRASVKGPHVASLSSAEKSASR